MLFVSLPITTELTELIILDILNLTKEPFLHISWFNGHEKRYKQVCTEKYVLIVHPQNVFIEF